MMLLRYLNKMRINIYYVCVFMFFIAFIGFSFGKYYQNSLNIKYVEVIKQQQQQQQQQVTVNEVIKEYVYQCSPDKIELSLGASDSVSDLDTIIEIIKFMFKNVKQDDEEFIEFVRQKLIKQPSKGPLNLKEMTRKDFSQHGQSLVMDDKLKSKRNGFFIEAGGYDGEEMSNTLFFELNRNWTGILIEPIPDDFNKLISKNRNVFAINACISGSKPYITKLLVGPGLSGRLSDMADSHKIQNNHFFKNRDQKFMYIPCIPLYTILKAVNVSHIDYFSLDVEGAEWEIISELPFDKIQIDSFSIEWSANPSTKEKIKQKLFNKGFELFKEDNLDLFLERKHV